MIDVQGNVNFTPDTIKCHLGLSNQGNEDSKLLYEHHRNDRFPEMMLILQFTKNSVSRTEELTT